MNGNDRKTLKKNNEFYKNQDTLKNLQDIYSYLLVCSLKKRGKWWLYIFSLYCN
jgi:hypothetical protein